MGAAKLIPHPQPRKREHIYASSRGTGVHSEANEFSIHLERTDSLVDEWKEEERLIYTSHKMIYSSGTAHLEMGKSLRPRLTACPFISEKTNKKT